MPFLVAEVRTLAPITGTWPGTCRVVCRHIGADLTASAVGKFVAPVLGPGTVARRCGDAVVHRLGAEDGNVDIKLPIAGIELF